MAYSVYTIAGAQPIANTETTQKHPLGTIVRGFDPAIGEGEFIYLLGIASTEIGSLVKYNTTTWLTTLLVGATHKNIPSPVAVAMAITDAATKFGWYGIQGTFPTDVVANSADNSTVGRETTDGKVGDGRAAGDQIANAFQRAATTAAAIVNVQFDHSYVDDFIGA